PPPARASSPPRPRNCASAAADAAWCRSAPPAAWAWWRSWSAEPRSRKRREPATSLAQPRQPVFVAFLHHRAIVDLLPQVALRRQGLDRVAAGGAQGVGVGDAGTGVVAGAGKAVAQLLPR